MKFRLVFTGLLILLLATGKFRRTTAQTIPPPSHSTQSTAQLPGPDGDSKIVNPLN